MNPRQCQNCGQEIVRVVLPGDTDPIWVHEDDLAPGGVYSAHLCKLVATPLPHDYEGPMPAAYRHPGPTEYIVLRGHPSLPREFMQDYEGRWITRPKVGYLSEEIPPRLTMSTAEGHMLDRWERRADGTIAQVAEVRP